MHAQHNTSEGKQMNACEGRERVWQTPAADAFLFPPSLSPTHMHTSTHISTHAHTYTYTKPTSRNDELPSHYNCFLIPILSREPLCGLAHV